MRTTAKVGFFRPIIHVHHEHGKSNDEDVCLITEYYKLPQTYEESYGLTTDEANVLLGKDQKDDLIDTIITKYKNLTERCDFVLCEGSDYLSKGAAVEFNLNEEIAKNLGCPILILGNANERTILETISSISISIESYNDWEADIVGVVVNKAKQEDLGELRKALESVYKEEGYSITIIPKDKRLSCPRVSDVVKELKGQVLSGHSHLNGLVSSSIVCAMQLQNALKWITEDDMLLVTSGDRGDIVVGALQAHQSNNYPSLAGLVLTGGVLPEPSILRLIDGLPERLPIISVQNGTFEASSKVNSVHAQLRSVDQEKIDLSIQAFETNTGDLETFRKKILSDCLAPEGMKLAKIITPKMFLYNLISQAKAKKKHIVLPEGNDPRILKAAAILVERDIVKITLLGKKEDILGYVSQYGVMLDLEKISIVDPLTSGEALEKYAAMFYELRKHKGTVPTIDVARDECLDLSMFGTMMVYCGDADGMVSGARHTTQHTIRPALQIIKTKPGFKIVSSIFLMCMDHKVLCYGDCAVNPNPTPEQLADIALASAETAQTFGIVPKVAMLSYSSGSSGKGSEVEKVREATRIAKERRPDLLIEGPVSTIMLCLAYYSIPNPKEKLTYIWCQPFASDPI